MSPNHTIDLFYSCRFLRWWALCNMLFFQWVWKHPWSKVNKCHFFLSCPFIAFHVAFVSLDVSSFPFIFRSFCIHVPYNIMFLSCCIYFLLFCISFLSCSFHFAFMLHLFPFLFLSFCFHVAFVSFHVPFMFLSCCICFLSFCIHFLSCSFHFAFMSFHFLSLCIKHTGLRKVICSNRSGGYPPKGSFFPYVLYIVFVIVCAFWRTVQVAIFKVHQHVHV